MENKLFKLPYLFSIEIDNANEFKYLTHQRLQKDRFEVLRPADANYQFCTQDSVNSIPNTAQVKNMGLLRLRAKAKLKPWKKKYLS